MDRLGGRTDQLGISSMIIHLVRHARPVVDPELPPSDWELAAESRTGIAQLRDSGALPNSALWVSSTEPKALATARSLADQPVAWVDALREMRRPAGLLGDEEFRAAVRASMLVPDRRGQPGWETGADTIRRVRQAVDTYVAAAGDRDLVLVGHGTAWTLLLADLTCSSPDIAAWEGLTMPDHCALRIDHTPARIVSPWGSWRAKFTASTG